MRKILIAIAITCFTLAGLTNLVNAKEPSLTDFKPTEDTYPMAPDEHAVALRVQDDIYVYKLLNEKGQCSGVAIANAETRYYLRLTDIGCDPDIDHVSFSPSELEGYHAITFYSKTVAVGRITIKARS